MTAAAAAKPVVLVRVPPAGGTGRNKLKPAEAAGGLFFGLLDFYGREVFDRYRQAAGALRFVAEPVKGQVGDAVACAKAVAALQRAGFEVRAFDAAAAERLGVGAAAVSAVVADADARVIEVLDALQARGLTPRPYQITGIRWLRAVTAGALLDDMGLGKTMQVLLAFGSRQLVFCPASVKGVWAREAGTWRPDLRPVVISGVRSDQGDAEGAELPPAAPACSAVGDDVASLSGALCGAPLLGFLDRKRAAVKRAGGEACGSPAKRVPALTVEAPVAGCSGLGADGGDPWCSAPALDASDELAHAGQRCSGSFRWPLPGELVIVNYDIVTPDDIEAAGPAPAGVDVTIDEGHVVKNARSIRAHAIKAVCAAVEASGGRRLMCTATPICNRPLELRAVLDAIGAFRAAFSSWTAFERAFGGAVRSAEAEPTEEATIALARVSLRRTKKDVAKDLPSLSVVVQPVELEGQAAELAAAVEAHLRPAVDAALAGIDPADEEAMSKAIEAALRAGSEIGEMSAARKVLALAKLPAAMQIVEACEDAGQPLIVASAHRDVCEHLAKRKGWAMIAGGVPEAERTRIIADFQAGKLRGIAMTIKAGGVGITLTRAAHMVAVDLEWNPALNEQLFARIHRIGQTLPCLVTVLRGNAWIEDRLAELLALKARMISATVDRVAELGGQLVEAPDMAAIAVGLPAPERAARPSKPGRAGWIADPALVARVRAAAAVLPAGHVAVWLARIAEEAGGELPPQVKGRDTRELVGASEAEAEQRREALELAEALRRASIRPALGPREEAAADAILQLAAADPDRASEQNEVGFAASTGGPGHRLAELLARGEGLTPDEWRDAIRIAVHHRRQVGQLPAEEAA